MKSFRAKPTGWRGESHRHYLAAKGIKTRHSYFRRRQEAALEQAIQEMKERQEKATSQTERNALEWELERLKERLEEEQKIKGPSQMPVGSEGPFDPTPKPQAEPEERKIMIAVTRLPDKDRNKWLDLDKEVKSLTDEIREAEDKVYAELGQSFETVSEAREFVKEARAKVRDAEEQYGKDSPEHEAALKELGDREADVADVEQMQEELSALKKTRTEKLDARDSLLGMQGRILPGSDKSLGRKMGRDRKRPRYTTLPGGSALGSEAAEALGREQEKQMRANRAATMTDDKPENTEQRKKRKFLERVSKGDNIQPRKG